MNRLRRLLVSGCVVAFAASALTAFVSGPGTAAAGPMCPRQLTGSTAASNKQSATSRPVVFVHGWTGTPMTGTAAMLTRQLGDRINPFQFDYSTWSSNWASNPNIASCLADYVNGVSAAYRAAGGDGRVVVVAHSMGGLAIRYATSGQYVAHPIPADEIPYVITIDTPHLGSPWGNTGIALMKELYQAVWGEKLPAPWGQDGQKCLAQHQHGSALPSGCGDLPPWLPASVHLVEIGGDVTVDRSLFGVTLYSIPLNGDGVVTLPSEHGYPVSGPNGEPPPGLATVRSTTDSCRVGAGAVGNAASTLVDLAPGGFAVTSIFDYMTLQDLQNNTFSPRVQAYMGGATLAAPCSHIGVTSDQSAIDQVTEAIKAALAGSGPTVRTLDQHLLPDPEYGPGYTTSGTYLQVSGADGLDAVNAALRRLITDDQQRMRDNYLQIYGSATQPGSYPGIYSSDPSKGEVSATTAVVSVLIPSTGIFPGGNDGDHWVSATMLVPSAKPVTFDSLFADPARARETISEAVLAHFLDPGQCVAQQLADPSAPARLGLAPTPDNYKHFAITPAGLTVGFDQGEIGMEACDRQSFTIGWPQLRSLLSPTGRTLVAELG
ncbi:alpha/beta fold hydrolase [Catenulispora rubra]|uniref:alpha/beta fold hydrolase n=1 Tax=Catenulispora rubra TaxID=280293 RepID=UPI001892049A|nr:alpha/beta fold hydrolase [Catenulispora rubra]